MNQNCNHQNNKCTCTKRPVKKSIWRSNCWCIVLALLAGFIVIFLLLMLFSLLMTSIDAPDFLVQSMACIALCAGSFTAGFVAAKHRRKKGLLIGLGCGIAMYFAVFLVGILVLQSAACAGTFIRLLFMILCSCIGGVVGINAKCRKPRC